MRETRMTWGMVLATALFAAVVPLSAQLADTALSFEVASIKPRKPNTDGINIQGAVNGRFNAENVTLKELVRFSYGLNDIQIAGGPDWLNADRFDVSAKPEGPVNPE